MVAYFVLAFSELVVHKAELLFRHKVLRLLRDRGLLSQERIDLLLSWRHSGFSVHNHTTVYPSDAEGLHKLACYLMRSPVNLSRLRYHPDSQLILYQPRAGHDVDEKARLDPLEFLARVLIHIPEPNKHLVHFYGAYANRVRQTFRDPLRLEEQAQPTPTRAANKRWRELIYRIYEVEVIRKILDHRDKLAAEPRAPPTRKPD